MKLVYGASIRGNGHFRTGVVCQDSNSFTETDFNDDEVKVIAISDGHGGAPYFRSNIGSSILVDITKSVLYDFVNKNTSLLDEISNMNKLSYDLDDLSIVKKEFEMCKNVLNYFESSKNKHKVYAGSSEEVKTEINYLSDLKNENNSEFNNKIKVYKQNFEPLRSAYEKGKNKKQNTNNGYKEDSNLVTKDNLIVKLNQEFSNVKEMILSKWKNEVDNHLKENPVFVSDITLNKYNSLNNDRKVISFTGYSTVSDNNIEMINKDLSSNILSSLQRNYYQMYGATLLACALYKSHVFLLQIGDGDITIVDDNDNVFSPIIKNEYEMANETDSICQNSAIDRFKEAYFEKKTKVIMLSTDGVVNALDDENYLFKIARGIYDSLCNEPEDFRKDFKPLLRKFSSASYDDVTILLASDVNQDVYNKVKDSVEVDEDITKLEQTHQALFNTYNLNSIYKLNDNHLFNDFKKDLFNEVLTENSDLFKKKGLFSKNKNVNIVETLISAYENKVSQVLEDNPIIIGNIKLSKITLDNNFTITEASKDVIVTDILDRNINYKEINNQNLFNYFNLDDEFKFMGKKITVKNNEITIN